MKKFTVLVALVLLAATGTSYAVTCAYDNVPAATLLVPYFKVSRNGVTSNATPIPEGGTDTLVAITNVSLWGVVAHVTVWNKQSAPVLDFNIPMTGFDVAFFRMKDILNGSLNLNETQVLIKGEDPCVVMVGNTQTRFVRFPNPDPSNPAEYSVYNTPAFSGGFRDKVWHSLDEGVDYNDIVSSPGNDNDNPACGTTTLKPMSGDFTGYLTIDVTNYCTQLFPQDENFYINDAIATQGWDANGGPNVLMGDVFFIDPAAAGGNISGDQAVALEFDNRLDWTPDEDRTFYARYYTDLDNASLAPAAFWYDGDGREPLGETYGFRYMNEGAAGLQTFITVWRSDLWNDDATTGNTDWDLCKLSFNTRPIAYTTWNNEEDALDSPTSPDPSGGDETTTDPFVWWEAQRIAIVGSQFTKDDFKGGWTWITFPYHTTPQYNQAYVGVMHTGPGLAVSVGHSATLLDQEFLCPGSIFVESGNVDYGTIAVQ
jgi:hypothetical protein